MAPRPVLPGVSVAFVRDWMTVYGGADRTMAAALELFPEAPIHTLVHEPEHFRDSPIARHRPPERDERRGGREQPVDRAGADRPRCDPADGPETGDHGDTEGQMDRGEALGFRQWPQHVSRLGTQPAIRLEPGIGRQERRRPLALDRRRHRNRVSKEREVRGDLCERHEQHRQSDGGEARGVLPSVPPPDPRPDEPASDHDGQRERLQTR